MVAPVKQVFPVSEEHPLRTKRAMHPGDHKGGIAYHPHRYGGKLQILLDGGEIFVVLLISDGHTLKEAFPYVDFDVLACCTYSNFIVCPQESTSLEYYFRTTFPAPTSPD